MGYIKIKLFLSAGDLEEEYIVTPITTDIEKEVINTASSFALKHNTFLPYDYIDDMMDPCVDEHGEYILGCSHVGIEFLESNIYEEDSFYNMWDNYMKAFGRGRL
jgi:hypothetical protein